MKEIRVGDAAKHGECPKKLQLEREEELEANEIRVGRRRDDVPKSEVPGGPCK